MHAAGANGSNGGAVKPCGHIGSCWHDVAEEAEPAAVFAGVAAVDPVDHPKHYTFGRFEVIDVIEDWDLGFHLGNSIKYIARAGKKGDALEDLRKARWYLDRCIAALEAER
jgi:hypothetical protein